jgi:hypothetical protein
MPVTTTRRLAILSPVLSSGSPLAGAAVIHPARGIVSCIGRLDKRRVLADFLTISGWPVSDPELPGPGVYAIIYPHDVQGGCKGAICQNNHELILRNRHIAILNFLDRSEIRGAIVGRKADPFASKAREGSAFAFCVELAMA